MENFSGCVLGGVLFKFQSREEVSLTTKSIVGPVVVPVVSGDIYLPKIFGGVRNV